MFNYYDKRIRRKIRLHRMLNLLAVNRVAKMGVAKKRVRFLKQKKAEKTLAVLSALHLPMKNTL
jgi:hypothetical protein